MLPFLLFLGVAAILADSSKPKKRIVKKRKSTPKKVFVSFSVEDKKYRDFLIAQSRNENAPFEFIDMSAREAWPEHLWKQKCRRKLRECDGLIVLLSNNTWHSSGVRWEIRAARQERLKTVGMHIRKNQKMAIPTELQGKKVITWSWPQIEKFINNL